MLDRKYDVNYLLSTPEGRTKTKLVLVDLLRRFLDRPDNFIIKDDVTSQLLDKIVHNTDVVTTCNVQLDAQQDMLSEEYDNVPGHIQDIARTLRCYLGLMIFLVIPVCLHLLRIKSNLNQVRGLSNKNLIV